ncbi:MULTISPECIES: Rdx family protein [Psychrilyobacter]|uniref:SelT/SelW/SelH family protein n=1 Tax=Psychrilyobacter piezotolerans TaxID=2293438 RepID=A0ABX9KIK1_9FUSO|nr:MULTISPECIES: Rdx family protein [Psychrilyobacter]MCS5420233.1 Rdx family protein [Psychrilyobacter sp. S5]NDI77258.1 SelT/SelW/SelH family protein [Psychrilyobacter piezotolerans]RDE63315.1 SelT/SelW/SelH family protein [Psychrilyobacter sp. S5]REI41857.1 SelT/SelW/SelH family protein [Psychrilyobacter piezotolerans]
MKPVLSIEFCISCGYEKRALTLMETFVRLYKNDVSSFNLIPSSGGAFEIKFEDLLIFSKRSEDRFPITEELLRTLDEKIRDKK